MTNSYYVGLGIAMFCMALAAIVAFGWALGESRKGK